MTTTPTLRRTGDKKSVNYNPGFGPCKLLIILYTLIASGPLTAEEVTISASQDNTIYSENNSGSNGAATRIVAGVAGSGLIRRALVLFADVAQQIPAGSTINSVEVRLQLAMPPEAAGGSVLVPTATLNLHRLTASWGEGTSSIPLPGKPAAATQDDATWLYRMFDDSQWATEGGDYIETLSATQSVTGSAGATAPFTWTSNQLVTDVQGWVDNPASNHGWMLKSPLEGNAMADPDYNGPPGVTGTAKWFLSVQGATPPQLVIDYTAGQDPGPDPVPDPTISEEEVIIQIILNSQE